MKNVGHVVINVAFLGLLAAGAVQLAKPAWMAASTRTRRTAGMTVVERIRAALVRSFPLRYRFIDLGGASARLADRRRCNGAVRERGHDFLVWESMSQSPVARSRIKREAREIAARFKDLDAWMKALGIRCQFIVLPTKMDRESAMTLPGTKSRFYLIADAVIKDLRTNGSKVMDLTRTFAATADDVRNNFYRTDHHWNSDASFRAFQTIGKAFWGETTPGLQDADWTRHEIPNWWLGSQGKRCGRYFAGVENFAYYLPNFETSLICRIPSERIVREGNFLESSLRHELIEVQPDFFEGSAYATFIGGDYGLVSHFNVKPFVNERVLLAKDSFALPVQAYLSSIVKRLDVIDLRHFKGESFVGYAKKQRPDRVVVMYNPGAFFDKDLMSFRRNR